MILVLDTSAAIEFILKKSHAPKIEKVLLLADRVMVPDLYVSELSNVLWKYVQFKQIAVEQCEKVLEIGLELPDEIASGEDLAKEAFSLACLENSPAYDMYFLVLARRYRATLVSLDKKLITLAKKLSINYEALHS